MLLNFKVFKIHLKNKADRNSQVFSHLSKLYQFPIQIIQKKNNGNTLLSTLELSLFNYLWNQMDYVGLDPWVAPKAFANAYFLSHQFWLTILQHKIDYNECLIAWIMLGQISTCFPQINLCKLKTVRTGIVKVLYLELGNT